MPSQEEKTAKLLLDDISQTVGAGGIDEVEAFSDEFYQVLKKNLESFNSSNFDSNGFLKKFSDISLGNKDDVAAIKRLIGNVQNEYIDLNSINNQDLLLRRDITNVCEQMPEMRDVIYIIRDSIVESDVVTGQLARTISFQHNEDDGNSTIARETEARFDLQRSIKNLIIPQTLMVGEAYVNVVPYARLFAELEAMHNKLYPKHGMKNAKASSLVSEAHPFSLANNDRCNDTVQVLTESVDSTTYANIDDAVHTISGNKSILSKKTVSSDMMHLLEKIDVLPNGSSVLMAELGPAGLQDLLMTECIPGQDPNNIFVENLMGVNQLRFDKLKEEETPYDKYKDVKGCYVKYLDPLRVRPIWLDTKVIGYYYISTQVDSQINQAQPTGVVDVSIGYYTKDRHVVSSLANIIVKSFDKQMLESNINLKNEIADVVMAHKFQEGRLTFTFIPETDICRFAVNEDADGKGHSVIEPSLFPARNYLLLSLYNMLFTLNNSLTRIHYMASSGLDKDYASLIQRTVRKMQQRRITIDDIFSYSGVLNKVGGSSEMVLPRGRSDFKAIETDTIAPVDNPISTEFLEQQRRQAISGTGVPALMVINAIDEIEFAKTLEMANTRYLSTVSAYKIDFNRDITRLYQKILKYTSNLSDVEINSFLFKFNSIQQPALNITTAMIADFNNIYQLMSEIYYTKKELVKEDDSPTHKAMMLKRELAKEFLPQLDYDRLEKIVDVVAVEANKEELADKAAEVDITDADMSDIDKGSSEETS